MTGDAHLKRPLARLPEAAPCAAPTPPLADKPQPRPFHCVPRALLDTQTELLRDKQTGLTWVIRLATALNSKPTAPATAGPSNATGMRSLSAAPMNTSGAPACEAAAQ